MVPGGKSRARTRGDRGAAAEEEGGEASDGLESSLDEFMMTERALLAEAQDDGGAQQQQQQEEGGDEDDEEGEESVPGFAKAIRRRGRREKGRGRRSGGSTHRRVGSTHTAQYYGQAETAQPGDGGNGRAYSSSWDKIHSLQIKLRECMADKEEMRDALDEAGLREGALRHQLEQVGAKAKKNNATAWKQRQRIELLEVRRTHPRPDSKFNCAADAW